MSRAARSVLPLLSALAAGLVFGVGLIVAGMSNPAKVIGFLDILGRWDPSLAFVMGGAVFMTFIGFWLVRRRAAAGGRSLFGTPLPQPRPGVIDRGLILGSAAFGIGWGLVGFCPGPALVALGAGESHALLFVAAMVAGMSGYALARRSGD